MIHEDDGVAVRDQVMHDACESDDVGGVKPDGGLVQYVQDSCGAVAHCAGELHPLAFSGGQGGGGAVQRQIPESQIQETFRHCLEGGADTLCHRAHLFRQGSGNIFYPSGQVRERHLAGFIQGEALQFRGSCRFGEPGTAAVRADVFAQEFLHPLHALFIFDFGEGVFHCVDCIEVGKIKLTGLI